MKKAVKIIFIIIGSLVALFVAFIILVSVYVVVKDVTADTKTIPSREDLEPNITDYLEDISEEHKQELIKEAVEKDYPVNWPMLWIVIKRVNLDAADVDGNVGHFDIEMSYEEADYLVYEMSERFSNRVSEYTNGLVNVEITPLLYDEVTYMEKNGEDLYLVADSFPDIKDEFPEYNTVMSTIRVRSGDGDEIRTGWDGLALSDWWPGSFGFTMAQTSDIPSYEVPSLLAFSDDNPVPEEVYIHEWLHTFEEFEIKMKNCDGNPDTAGEHGYECLTTSGENGNYEFYRDLLNRNVWDDKIHDYVGMDTDLWHTYAMLMDIAKGRYEYGETD